MGVPPTCEGKTPSLQPPGRQRYVRSYVSASEDSVVFIVIFVAFAVVGSRTNRFTIPRVSQFNPAIHVREFDCRPAAAEPTEFAGD